MSSEVARRTVLGAGALTGLGLVAGCTSDDKAAATPPAASATDVGSATPSTVATEFDPKDWVSVRAQFPLDPEIAQFAAFVLASHPAPVSAAIQKHRDGLDFDTEGYLLTKDFESEARQAAAGFLDVDAQEVALTDSATMGLGLMYTGLKLGPGDEVVTTTHDFYSTHESLRLAAQRTGAKVRKVALYDDPARADRGEIVGRVTRAIGPSTRVLAITWVHSGTGVRLPVADITAAVAKVNERRSPDERVIVCVDGVHGFGLIDESMPELGCDFFVSGTHKWLFGPRGTGIFWGRAWDRMRATIPNFSGAPPNSPGGYNTPGGYHSFEHRWAVKDAFELHAEIGAKQIEERTLSQASQLKEGLAAIDGVRVVTPMDAELSAGIVCLELGDWAAPDAVFALLDEHKIRASVTPYATTYVRFGPSIVTTPDEVDAAVEAVAALAAQGSPF